MAMAMDEQLFVEDGSWARQLQRGNELTLIPLEDEPFVVSHVFLVDPESAAGQGVVAAWVEMGTRKIMLAELSSEITDVKLENPVLLNEEFCLHVAAHPGDDADADSDEDALVVQFEGFMLVPYPDTDEESDEEDEDEEAVSSEDDDDKIGEEYEVVEESDGEVDRDVARESSAGDNPKDVQNFRQVAARKFLGLFLFTYIIALFRLLM